VPNIVIPRNSCPGLLEERSDAPGTALFRVRTVAMHPTNTKDSRRIEDYPESEPGQKKSPLFFLDSGKKRRENDEAEINAYANTKSCVPNRPGTSQSPPACRVHLPCPKIRIPDSLSHIIGDSMFWKNKAGLWPLILALASMGCTATNHGPVRSAEVFLELSASASAEQFLNLNDAIRERICAQEHRILEEKARKFAEALDPEIRKELALNASDIITGFSIPEGLETDSGQIESASADSAQVSFKIKNEKDKKKTLKLSMVLEENQWKACSILQSGLNE